jgi:hypothetical protein
MRRFLLTTLALLLSNVFIGPRTTIPAKASRFESTYAPGEVIVKLKHGAGDLAQLAATIGSADSNLALLRDDNPEPLVRHTGAERLDQIISRNGLDRTFVLKVDPGIDLNQIIARLNASDAVEYADELPDNAGISSSR